MSKIIYFIKQSWLLVVASLCFGLILAVAEGALGPRIAANQKSKLYALCQSLMVDASSFEEVYNTTDQEDSTLPPTSVLCGKDSMGRTLGYAFIAEGSGFADKIKVVIVVDDRFETFFGFDVLASNETPGFGDKIKEGFFRNQFVGAPVGPLELVKVGNPETLDPQIVAISGATVSSDAVVNIFNNYVQTIRETLIKEGIIHGQ